MFVGSMSATIGSMVTVELICRSFSAAATAFGNAGRGVGLVEQRLPLEVAQFDEIAIDDPQHSDAGADQQIGDRAAQRPAAAQQRPRLRPAAAVLPRPAAETASGGRSEPFGTETIDRPS